MRRLVALLLLLALTGCGVPVESEPRALDPDDAPFGVLDQPTPDAEGPGRVALYFVRNDKVVLQPRAVERSMSIDELLDLLLAGPTPEQVSAGTSSAIPTGLAVEDVDVGPSGVAVVTLEAEDGQVSTSPLGFAQIVATLTAPGRARAVQFRLEGQDLRVPRGDGSLTSEPVDRSDYAEVLALQSPPTASPSPS